MATNHMATNQFSTATLTSRLLHSAEGRLRVPTIPHKNSETALIFHPFHRQSNVVGRLWGNFGGK